MSTPSRLIIRTLIQLISSHSRKETFFSTSSLCDINKNILLLSLFFKKCAWSHAPINLNFYGKKKNISNRENTYRSGEDTVIPSNAFLNENELPVRAELWGKGARSLSADTSFLLLEHIAGPARLFHGLAERDHALIHTG